jgi:hypothetical protein
MLFKETITVLTDYKHDNYHMKQVHCVGKMQLLFITADDTYS